MGIRIRMKQNKEPEVKRRNKRRKKNEQLKKIRYDKEVVEDDDFDYETFEKFRGKKEWT